MSENSGYTLLHPTSPEEWESYYQLRYDVLRKPWNQPFSSTKDDTEDESIHLLMLDTEGKAAAAGRLQLNSQEQGQLRSMAVRAVLQGTGLGTQLIRELEAIAIKKGLQEIVLDARENAVSFYQSNGYTVTGPSYLLFGRIPHFRMRKKLLK